MGVNPNAPNWKAPLVNPDGTASQAWFGYLIQLGGYAPAAIATVDVAGSPFTYTASAPGTLVVSGGTVLSITLTRAQMVVSVGFTSGSLPMSAGDKATIIYSSIPIVNFIPN